MILQGILHCFVILDSQAESILGLLESISPTPEVCDDTHIDCG